MALDMIMMLLGGLGLFIFGMNMMSDGLKNIAGNRMKNLLEALTNNRLMGVLVGTIVTAIVQSSSAVTVMVVGFVNAGIMNLLQATGIIMGANIGTTVTAQLVAFNLTQFAPLAIASGAVMYLFGKKKRFKQVGYLILGFGILFLGMKLMSDAMKPLRDFEGFKSLLISFSHNPILGVLAGFILTAIIQSSSASIGLLQALAISGAFNIPEVSPLTLIIPVLMGQNIGTCVTSMLSSIGTTITAKRAALIHLFFNVLGTLWFLIILSLAGNPIYNFITSISGTTLLEGNIVPDLARQIANTHTIFNVANTLVLLPFAYTLVKISEKALPGKDKEDRGSLKFLDERILENPAIAVGQAIKETVRMGRLALDNIAFATKAFLEEDEELIEEVFKKEQIINELEREITKYLVALSNSNLSDMDYLRISNLFHTINDIERIGDHGENLAELAQYRIEHRLLFSNIAIDELKEMIHRVQDIISKAIDALEHDNIQLAKTIEDQEQEIDILEQQLRDGHIKRLNNHSCHPSSGVIFLDMISNLERIADHATNIGKTVIDLEKI